MSLNNTWPFIMGLLTICVALDNISTQKWKSIIAQNLIIQDRATFTKYVAGNSLAIYEKIFSKVFLSWKFFIRSGLITLLFASIGIWFLYVFYPHTFFGATSYPRSYLNSPNAYFAAGIPIIIFILFDFLCNGQTKYFLEIMKSSGSLSKFIMIGYGDLVVTTSLGIVSITVSLYVFSFFSLTNINYNSKIVFDFSRPYDFKYFLSDKIKLHKENGDFMHVVTYAIPINDNNRKLNDKESRIVEKYPSSTDGKSFENKSSVKFSNVDPQDEATYLIIGKNKSGITTEFYSDLERSGRVLISYEKKSENLESSCKNLSNLDNNKRFRIHILKGWDKTSIFNACKNKKSIELQLDFRVRQNSINYKKVLAYNLGHLITLLTESLLIGFNSYLYTSPVQIVESKNNWNSGYGHWLIGEGLVLERQLENIFLTHWKLLNGGYRFIETGGYPWSTFFVVTLFTSMFIWFVIIYCILLYPAIMLLERFAGKFKRIKIEKYPFTTIFLVFFVYLLIYEIFVVVI
jgi:hypothetical protein